MNEKQDKILRYAKDLLKTKTAFELYREFEKMALVIRRESQKESDPKNKTKSVFSDEPN